MVSIVKFYELHTVTGFTFRFKLDLNPLAKELNPIYGTDTRWSPKMLLVLL